jgi:hypothetical protein
MVGLVPTIHLTACAGARGWLDPRDKPEDDSGVATLAACEGRYADPARAPIGFALGGQTLQLRVHGAMARREDLTPRMGDMVPGVGFEPTSPRLRRLGVAKLRLDALSPD